MNLSLPLLNLLNNTILLFNCEEKGLNFRLLPDKSLASSFEKSADGRKKVKRVTINACANATGTVKLPLQLIGKAKGP